MFWIILSFLSMHCRMSALNELMMLGGFVLAVAGGPSMGTALMLGAGAVGSGRTSRSCDAI